MNPSVWASIEISLKRGKFAGPIADKQTHARVREANPNDSAHAAPASRFQPISPGSCVAQLGAQRRANRQFLLPRTRPAPATDSSRSRRRSASPARSFPSPPTERRSTLPIDFLFQRTNHRRNFPGLVDMRIRARTVGPRVHPDRQHARQVRIGLRNRHSGLQPCDAVKPESRQESICRDRTRAAAIKSKSVSTNRNPCGITPTISRGRASTVMFRPIAERSPPKRRCQYP